MTAVVLGGSGFLGSHLCDALLARGQDVIAVDDLSTGRLQNIEHLKSNKSFKFIQADISLELPNLGTPELILNFASPASPRIPFNACSYHAHRIFRNDACT